MSIYYTLDGGEPALLASNSGWGDFCTWVEGLPQSPGLAHLVAHGWEEGLPALRAELRAAVKASSPAADVRAVARSLWDALGSRASVLTITDGTSP